MAKQNTQTANVLLTLDGKQAEKMLGILNKKSETLRDEIRNLNNQRITVGLSGDEAKRFDALKKEFRDTGKQSRELSRQLADVSGVINSLSTKPINAIKDAIKAVTTQMNKLDRGTEAYANREKQLRLLRKELDNITESGRKNVSVLDQIGATTKRIASYVLVYAGFNELTSGLRKMYDLNVKLSDQLADIEKTTGITGRELMALSDDINKINTRTSVEQLNNLAIAAGKIGIQGRKDVLEFVKAGNMINVALGEDLGEDAIKNIAKLNDVLGITKELGVEKALLSTGSAINELGQSSTASESYLVDFAQRLGGIASQAEITMQQILALGSVADQLGQNVEVSATALNKFITTIVANTDKVAKAIGVTSAELRGVLDQSTWDGLLFVFEKLQGRGGLAGLAPIMEDLGSDGARLTAVLSALTKNASMLTKEVNLSNKAFEEATSVVDETTKKEESFAGIVAKIGKNVTEIFQKSEIVERFRQLALYVYNVTSQFDEFGNKIGGATNIIITIVGWLVKLGTFLFQHIDFLKNLAIAWGTLNVTLRLVAISESYLMVKQKALNVLTATATTLQIAYNTALSLFRGKLKDASSGAALLGKSLKGIPMLALATAAAAVVTGIIALGREMTKASREAAKFRSTMNAAIADETAEATHLFTSLQNTVGSSKERLRIIDEINTKYKDYLPNLINETMSNEELATALKTVNDRLQEKIVLEMKNEEMNKITRESLTSQMDLLDKIRSEIKAPSFNKEQIVKEIKGFTELMIQEGQNFTTTWNQLVSKVQTLVPAGALSSDFYVEAEKYVRELFDLRQKTLAATKRFDAFIPQEQNTGNVIPEVVVTGKQPVSKEESDKERKKRLKTALDDVDAYVDQEKTKLIQARINKQKYRDEDIDSEKKYNDMLEQIEFEGVQKKLQIAGLDQDKRAEIERRLYDFKLKLFNREEAETKSYLEKLDKLYDQFDLAGASRDQRELIRIQQKYNDAVLLLKDALKKELISQVEYEKQIAILKDKEKEAEDTYFKNKASKDAEKQLKKLKQEQSDEELIAAQKRINGLYTEQEYKAKLLEIEIDYQNKRLDISGLTEEQITELKQKNADRQISILNAASRKQEQIQKKYEELIKNSLTGVGEAFGNLISGEEDAVQAFGNSMVDILFDVLNQLVTIWTLQLAGTAVKTTAQAQMEAMSTPDSVLTFGASGLARAAIMAGIISAILAVAKAGLKSAINGKKSTSSSQSTGQRVVKGYSVGGYSGDGGVHEVAGVVHKGEYIVPAWQLRDPVSFNYVRALETSRQKVTQANPLPRAGYAEGGPVQTSVPPFSISDPELSNTLKQINVFLQKLDTKQFTTVLNVSRLNDFQNRLSASVARGSRPK